MAKTIITSLIISALTALAVGWGLVQRHDERLSALEQGETVRRAADQARDEKIDDLQRLLIRVDERTAGTDARLQRMESALDRQRP